MAARPKRPIEGGVGNRLSEGRDPFEEDLRELGDRYADDAYAHELYAALFNNPTLAACKVEL